MTAVIHLLRWRSSRELTFLLRMVDMVNVQLVHRLVRLFDLVLGAVEALVAREAHLAVDFVHVQDVEFLEIAFLVLLFGYAHFHHPLLDVGVEFLEDLRYLVHGVVHVDAGRGQFLVLLLDYILLCGHQLLHILVLLQLLFDVVRFPFCIEQL